MPYTNPHIYIPAIIGIFIIIFEVYAYASNRKFYNSNRASEKIKVVYKYQWVLGVVIAISSSFFSYHANIDGQKFLVFGFPFVVAGFDEKMYDYVSEYTQILFVLNAIIWFKFTYCIMYFIQGFNFSKSNEWY